MPRQTLKALTALAVDKITTPGYHRVGGIGGLCLRVRATGARSWILRDTFGGVRRDIGLGSYPDTTLLQARERARQIADRVWAGEDPVGERRALRAATAEAKVVAAGPTFDEVVRQFIAAKVVHLKNAKHQAQWAATIATYASPTIGAKAVAEIDTKDVLGILEPLWAAKPETASRLRGRLDRVLGFSTAKGLRAGPNPAAWKGHLDSLLAPAAQVRKVRHHAAMAVGNLACFVAALKEREGVAARALEFLILTGARSGEVRGATWSEIDLEAATWTIPADRMKAAREHRVALSARAIEILTATPRFATSDLIWPGMGGKQPMSDMTLASVLKRMEVPVTVHGFRSTFRDWAAERTDFPREVAEFALAHDVGSEVERAYRRGSLLEKRRELMKQWAEFVGSAAPAKVNDR